MIGVELATNLILLLEIGAEATLLVLIVRLTRKSEAFEARAIKRTDELKDHVELEIKKLERAEHVVDVAPQLEPLRLQLIELSKGVNALIEAHNAATQGLAEKRSDFNGIDPTDARAARTEKEDLRELTKAQILGSIGPAKAWAFETFFPDQWKAAIARPGIAKQIITAIMKQLEERAEGYPANGAESIDVKYRAGGRVPLV